MADQTFLAYHEPSMVTILTYVSFLLFLAIVNNVLDRTIYCGLIGQVFIGVWYGTPGLNWLSQDAQDIIMQLGYLGLLLLVYEGGLTTKIGVLKANLYLSTLVATVGVGVPIALSFLLINIAGATPLEAFAAGAALCCTSLGTTFTVLATSRLTESRVGVIVTGAAILDDVVGLVMVKIISGLGGSGFSAATVIRPVFVSIAFAVIVPLICAWVVGPLTRRFAPKILAPDCRC